MTYLLSVPIEIIRDISLLLEPYELAICHSLKALYTNDWWRTKILFSSGKIVNDNIRSFPLLYKRLLSSGNIVAILDRTFDQTDLCITGVKAISTDYEATPAMILQFDGDLLLTDGKESNVIATGVTDIEKATYIRGRSWFFIDELSMETILITTSDEHFISVHCDEFVDYVYAITGSTFYSYGSNPHSGPDEKRLKSKKIPGIRGLTYCDDLVLILSTDKLYLSNKIPYEDQPKFATINIDATLIDSVYPNLIKFKDGTYTFFTISAWNIITLLDIPVPSGFTSSVAHRSLFGALLVFNGVFYKLSSNTTGEVFDSPEYYEVPTFELIVLPNLIGKRITGDLFWTYLIQ